MEMNMGIAEQAIRFVAGFAILVYAALSLCCGYQAIAVIIGTILLVTGGIGYCPMYALIGMLSGKKKDSSGPMSKERFDQNVEYREGQTTKSKRPFEQRQAMKK
jgi:hypothetical protein